LRCKHSKLKFDTVIIRFAGEIGVKADWTRKLYERWLVRNIKAVLKHYGILYGSLNRTFGRLYLKTSEALIASQKLAKVFGASSFSPALETTSKLDSIIDAGVHVASFVLEKEVSFAVRCRRVGKHGYTSQEVCRQMGRQILDTYSQLGVQVNLEHPDLTFGVEVKDKRAFIFIGAVEGVGGLPLGTQSKLVCLLTDDLNSAVACWLTMRRGCPSVLVHFDNGPFAENNCLDSVLNYSQVLSEWSIGFPRKLRVISNGQNFAEIVSKCPRRLNKLLCKRLLFKIGERICELEKAEGLVTGETLGDQSGLILRHFRIEDEVLTNYPAYRPIQGFNTSEIKQLALKMGITEKAIAKTKKKGHNSSNRSCAASLNLEDLKNMEEKLLKIDEMVETSMKSLSCRVF
jgi:thiamine biosynthesis protein ThiI